MSATAEPALRAGLLDTLADDVLDGLTRPFKELPPKHLYDERGSVLFDRICELPEYYPTRTERSILERHAGEIAAHTEVTELLELGAGSASKTGVLLGALAVARRDVRYVPVDVSASALEHACEAIGRCCPEVAIDPVVGEFEDAWALPVPEGRLVAFLGGTLGNFLPGSRRRFLRRLGEHLGPGGHALLGIDLVKDRDEVLAAYDDAEGVTAAFNRNVLAVLNERLGADFDLANFEHVARYDDHHDWIEMRLRALRACTVSVAALGLQVQFAAGEELRTEISAKFTRERFETDLRAGGLRCCAFFTDPGERFALVLCRAT